MDVKLECQNVFQIWVAGVPYAQTRARHVIKGGRVIVFSDASDGLKLWKKNIKAELKRAIKATEKKALVGALCVDMVFHLPIKDKSRWGELLDKKPDKDNLEKAVLDCMESVGMFSVGDSQVCSGETIKLNCAPAYGGVLIKVSYVRIKKSPNIAAEAQIDSIDWLA